MKIAIISSSVRTGRNSHRVALFFRNYIEANNLAIVDLLDLSEYKFPIFEERLRNIENPSASVLDFADRIKKANGVIIVSPEYNGGYPASLKNVIDLLYTEWKRKPIALATASNGPFGGAQAMTSLVFSLWKIGVWLVPAMFSVPNLQSMYNEDGTPFEQGIAEKKAKHFIDELLWCIEANTRMEMTNIAITKILNNGNSDRDQKK